MSESIQETEDYLHEQLFGEGPKSVGEAVETVEAPPPAEDAPLVVEDEPPAPVEEPGEAPLPETPSEPAEEIPEEIPEDEGLVWAKRKYGDDPDKWARAAYEQERHITAIAREKREAEQLAQGWYEYAQQIEQQASQQSAAAMPLSAQEEAWVEQSMADPAGYARTAALNGRTQLYQGVINRVAEENPGLAASIGTQVQLELAQYANVAELDTAEEQTLEQALTGSFQRLGLSIPQMGARMSQKIGELGEYHPYVRAILDGDDAQRDLAVQAVSDLVRATSFTPRQAQQQANIAKENEMRRDVSSVQTGGVTPPPAPTTSPLLSAMEEEWRERGQWSETD